MTRQTTQKLITALYPRLSHEDTLQGESNSISNHFSFLGRVADCFNSKYNIHRLIRNCRNHMVIILVYFYIPRLMNTLYIRKKINSIELNLRKLW